MIEILRYEAHHVALMTPQPAQAHELTFMSAPLPEQVDESMTITADGLPVCCVGLCEVWPGRAAAWALLSADSGPHMLSITRAIRFRLERARFVRIEMAVDASFDPGQRWALMLGFARETDRPLRKFLPGGRDAWLFSRIR